jgi:hypothetical protein
MTCRQLCNGERISIAVHDRYSVARKTRTSESLRAPVEILVSELKKSALSAEGFHDTRPPGIRKPYPVADQIRSYRYQDEGDHHRPSLIFSKGSFSAYSPERPRFQTSSPACPSQPPAFLRQSGF